MLSNRSLAAGLTIALTTVGFAASGTSFGSAGASTGEAPVIEGVGNSLIRGYVVDQGGRHVDDMLVEATRDTGELWASSLTYASERPDGPQHGYFYLNLRRGTYDVRISKSGYVTETIEDVRVRRRETVNLEEVPVLKKLVDTRTVGRLKDDTVLTTERARIVVTVENDETDRPTGKVQVKESGEVVASARLEKSDEGKVTITLDRLAKGTYELKALYEGTPYLKASESRKVELTVRKPRR